jgi:hypothetical protein
MIKRISPHLLLTGAEKYFDAAKSVCDPPQTSKDRLTCRASFPAYFLVGRSIELSLKAFLFARGEKIDRLKQKYGHDLSKLISESRRRKLGNKVKLSRNHLVAIQLLNGPYKLKLLEYTEVGAIILPYYWIVCEVALNLIGGLKSYCYKTTFKKEFPIFKSTNNY